MATSRLITLFLALGVTSAQAGTCVIVVPNDQLPGNASPRAAYLHEYTHCKGWEDNGNILPPLKWRKAPWPKGMQLKVMSLPTSVTEQVCRAVGGDSYACQFFE